MFQRRVMKDGRKFKRTVSFLNLGGCRIKNRMYKLNFGFIKLTRMIVNIIWLRGRSLVNISYKEEGSIPTVCNEGYTRVDLWDSFECSK
jgi:hypothetical protein